MKRLLFILPATMLFAASCGNNVDSDDIENTLSDFHENGEEDKEHFDEDAKSFSEGRAIDGEEYFFGVLAEVVEIDITFREIEELDAADADISDFNETLDECIAKIDGAREAMMLYTDQLWPLKDEFHDVTMDWFDAMEGLVVDHLRGLAEPMSRPDDTWEDAEYEAYDLYATALKDYYEVDGIWVEYQFTFAEANDFKLNETETIDIDAMVEDEIDEILE